MEFLNIQVHDNGGKEPKRFHDTDYDKGVCRKRMDQLPHECSGKSKNHPMFKPGEPRPDHPGGLSNAKKHGEKGQKAKGADFGDRTEILAIDEIKAGDAPAKQRVFVKLIKRPLKTDNTRGHGRVETKIKNSDDLFPGLRWFERLVNAFFGHFRGGKGDNDGQGDHEYKKVLPVLTHHCQKIYADDPERDPGTARQGDDECDNDKNRKAKKENPQPPALFVKEKAHGQAKKKNQVAAKGIALDRAPALKGRFHTQPLDILANTDKTDDATDQTHCIHIILKGMPVLDIVEYNDIDNVKLDIFDHKRHSRGNIHISDGHAKRCGQNACSDIEMHSTVDRRMLENTRIF